MVLPTRGEGFNLPAAEAIAAGLKLIVTRYGGHMDYCAPGSAQFIKYKFQPSLYQVTDGTSLWAEPDLEDLCAAMQEAKDGSFNTDDAARAKVLMTLASGAWVKRIGNAVDDILNFHLEPRQ